MRPHLVALTALALALPAAAAPEKKLVRDENAIVDPALYDGLELRMIGPTRGGRVTAVSGAKGQPHTFYFGATGGGVWKTVNAGQSWKNVSDDFFGVGSIGAIAVSDADPNVVYVGTGSACPRGNVSVGDGVYRSTDAGRTWEHVGLADAGQIGRIRIHPRNPDVVYVAALGHAFGPNEERGVFRSRDGGASWEKVLYVSDGTGAVDLAMNPQNPRELYAAMWRFERKPWTLIDGGEESGLYRSRDGGDTWEELTGEGGLPPGKTDEGDERLIGRIGVSVSPTRPERVWALVTATGDRGGLYRSDDAGEKWTRVSGDRELQTRGWYYSHVYADPRDENTVYVMNVRFWRSLDGGKSFERVSTLHGDNHDLWIDPDDTRTMIEGNDGGGHVSLDGGDTWSTLFNQPTAELYRVSVDEAFPYRVYAAQQDNTTISVPSRDFGGITPLEHWFDVAGGESGYVAVHPGRPELTYAGNYIGQIDRYDRSTGLSRNVILYPELADGVAPRDLHHRFQWNAPIVLSPHDPDVVYHASNRLHRTRDGGVTWETISPDLTRNDPEKGALPGSPIQHDHTGVEVYNTIFAVAESPHAPGELWVGTDDGRVHLSRDDGASWTEITPKQMPEEGTVNTLELSPHDPGRAFLAVYRYRRDDFRPYVFRTDDYGATWRSLADGKNGIPADHPVRVVREDPERRGLLFAGTEFALYVSFDDGAHWQTLQLNLPHVPITDLKLHRGDLVVATQGRSFWVLDDVGVLRQLSRELDGKQPHFFAPRPTVRAAQTGRFRGENAPDPHPAGAVLRYYLPEEIPDPEARELKLDVLDADGTLLRSFSSKPEKKRGSGGGDDDRADDPLPVKQGLNAYVWDLRTERLELVEGAVMSLSDEGGAWVPPGRYEVRFTLDDRTVTHPLEVLPDPRLPEIGVAELGAQYAMLQKIRARFDEVHGGVRQIRSVEEQLEAALENAEASGVDVSELRESADALTEAMQSVEEELIQTKNEAAQDPLNFPPKLDNQLVYLWTHVNHGYGRPTPGAEQRLADLEALLAPHLERLDALLAEDLPAFNALLAERGGAGVLAPRRAP